MRFGILIAALLCTATIANGQERWKREQSWKIQRQALMQPRRTTPEEERKATNDWIRAEETAKKAKIKGASAYDNLPEPERAKAVAAWEAEKARVAGLIAYNEGELPKAQRRGDLPMQALHRKMAADLGRRLEALERNDPPYFTTKGKG